MNLALLRSIVSFNHPACAFLFCTALFFSTALFAAPDNEVSANMIRAGQMVAQQELPSLNGAVAPQQSSNAPTTLDITQAVNRAVQWHPDIAEVVGKLYEQAEGVNVARSKYFPKISAGMNNGMTNASTNSGYNPSFVLSLSQMLYDFGKVDSSVRAAEASVAKEQANVLVSIDTIAHDTAAAVVQVQGYQQLVKIAEAQLEALNNIGKLARQRNDEGASSLSDVVQTETRIEGARSTLMQYQANLDRWRATLSTYLGWRDLKEVSNNFPVPLTKSCQVAQPDYRLIPSVLAAWAQVNQAQANLDNANAQMTPTVSLEPEVTHYLTNNYSNSAVLDRTQYGAWVKVEMPLYQGGGLTASRNAAAHTLESANAAVRNAQLDAQQKLSESQNEEMSLARTLVIQNRQQQLAERTRVLYQDQYLQLGTRPLLDVLNSEQEIYQARFTEQQTISQLHTLQLDCLYSTGFMRSAFALNNQTIQTVEIQP
ncbi:TolC family outer membrane protein [Winslowiella iniecta]|uniref:TolC family outer membrane protein n=1 Tax=Winslowiella iniecta TaxID=1560201 RepID=UPI000A99AAA3|nr:TolC family outer membrane protein [Winslowiella iniecta]